LRFWVLILLACLTPISTCAVSATVGRIVVNEAREAEETEFGSEAIDAVTAQRRDEDDDCGERTDLRAERRLPSRDSGARRRFVSAAAPQASGHRWANGLLAPLTV